MGLLLEVWAVVFGAIAIDLAFGDPKNRYHPTAWAGGMMAAVITRFAGRGSRTEKFGGAAAVLITACAAVSALLSIDYILAVLGGMISLIASILAGCLFLKCTIAIRGMQVHADAVVASLREGGTKGARARLSTIVKRDTGSLDDEHIISGVLESIGENTTDGVTGSLFYYGLFGLPGAFVHRIVNTADSMAGYQNSMLGRLGWFAARSDTVLNYLPARLTGLAMVGASALLGYDWRGAYHTMRRDGGATASRNSGYAMAALAGALNVRLEKEGHYVLGGAAGSAPAPRDVGRAMRLMKATTLVFAAGIVLPLGVASAVVANVLMLGGAW